LSCFQSNPKYSRVATSTRDRGKIDSTKRAVPTVMTELRTITAIINSTRTMEMVSAVYCHAKPLVQHITMKKVILSFYKSLPTVKSD
jgi:hypothetical protein